MTALEKLCKTLSMRAEIRKIYILKQRSGSHPGEDEGIELAMQIDSISTTQKQDILNIIEDSGLKLASEPILLGDASSSVRTRILEHGKLIYDQSASPTSPT